MNNVIIAGRLVADPELQITRSGTEYVKLRVAIKRDYAKDGSQESDFVNVKAWRKTAVFINQYFSKGDGIVLSGRLETGSYQTNSGEKRYTTEIIADHVEFPLSKSSTKAISAQNDAIPLPESDEPLPSDSDDFPF